MNFYVPMIILIVSNVGYQVCSKGTPSNINPLAMLTVTYLIASVLCGIAYYALHMGDGLLGEYQHLNWAGFLMGLAVVGMEVGSIYMYKVGWQVSVGFIFSSSIIAVCLLILGVLVYKEAITITKVAGVIVCLFGMFLINK